MKTMVEDEKYELYITGRTNLERTSRLVSPTAVISFPVLNLPFGDIPEKVARPFVVTDALLPILFIEVDSCWRISCVGR